MLYFEKRVFKVVGKLVINDVESGRVSVVLYLGVTVIQGVSYRVSLAVFDED